MHVVIILTLISSANAITFWNLIQSELDLSNLKLSTDCGSILKFMSSHGFLKSIFPDVSGKQPTTIDILDGTFSSFGHYDECLRIRIPFINDTNEIKSKYCNLKFIPNPTDVSHHLDPLIRRIVKNLKFWGSQFKITIGTCLPVECSDQDVRRAYRDWESPDELILFDTNSEILCDQLDDSAFDNFSGFQWICLFYSTFLITLIALARIRNVIRSGGISRSINSFKDHSAPQTEENEIHFITSLLIAFVAFVNCCLPVNDPTAFSKYKSLISDGSDTLGSFSVQVLLSDQLSSALFLLSGISLTVSTGKSSLMDSLKFLTRKYFMLIFLYLTTVAINVSIVPIIGSGPQFKELMIQSVSNCEKYWWKLPFMANYDGSTDCLVQLWFIPILMQLTVIGVIVLSVIRWHETSGLLITFMVMMAGNGSFRIQFIGTQIGPRIDDTRTRL